ncbi:cytochrome c1 [Ameyamaea chiangmaiensis]|nr:cytochrome c1 [Ameyamaea chiangmaiensis]
MSRLHGLAAALAVLGGVSGVRAEVPTTRAPTPAHVWSFDGPMGRFDMASVQRGYAVYNQVCSACHGMAAVTYGDLAGIGLNEAQVRQIAASHKVPGPLDDDGHPTRRPATPNDHLLSPFPNPQAAMRANSGVVPPDQSRLAMVFPGGPSRIYALLTSYGPAPAGMTIAPGHAYNPYFDGRQTAMPQPLRDHQVTYADGTDATLAREAEDVTNFLAWAAWPHLAERHRIGARIVLYLVFLFVLTILLKRKVWSHVH